MAGNSFVSWESLIVTTFRQAHIPVVPTDSIKNLLVGDVGKPAIFTSSLVILKPRAQTLWPPIESVPKRLVDAVEYVGASHENLWNDGSLEGALGGGGGEMVARLSESYSLESC